MPPEQFQPVQYQYQQRQLPVKKLVIIAAVAIVVLLVLSWVVNNGYIKVTTQNGEGEISYSLTNQANQKDVKASGEQSSFKTTLGKGTYEVLVRSGNKSYFSLVDIQGLLKTTDVNATLESERGRRFIGHDPESCVHLIKQTLVSYECIGPISTLKTHVPATPSLPTYSKINPYSSDDIVEGIVETKSGDDLVVIYEVEVAGHGDFEPKGTSHHNAFRMTDSGIIPSSSAALGGLDEKLYSFLPYKDGFIAYDDELSKILYYQKLGSKPTEIKTGVSKEGLSGYSVSTDQDALVVGYSEKGIEGEEKESSRRKSEIAIIFNDSTKHISLDQTYNSVRLCGDNLLCALSSEKLDVFDVSAERPVLRFSLSGVSAFVVQNNRLVVAKDKDILSLDVASRSGYIEYNLGDYSLCGLHTANSSYMICVSDSRGKRSLLLIDQSKTSDDIDKKILKLQDLAEVKEVSIYGDYIFISPEAGQLKFIPSLGGYSYDPEVLKNANDKINAKVNELGIDRNKYRVKSTLK